MTRRPVSPRPATTWSASPTAAWRPTLRPTVLAVSVAACFGLASVAALANPSGASVVSGSASFAASGSQLTITNSPNAIINWQSFSIGVNEVTRFIQQNAASAVLNRVVGSGGVIPQSVIDGILSSNGRVFLMNNSGVVFGPNARIDVAGLIASSLNLSNEDFLAGRMRFTEVLGAGGISNTGLIETPSGGRVFLVAPDVTNSGIIRAPQGEIVLAAGKSVELVTEGSPYVTVKVTNTDAEQALNMGSLVSQGGRISMGAALVRNTGVVEAGGAVVGDGGVIRLVASKDLTLAAGSRASVTGGSTSGNAGTVTIQSETGTTLVYGTVDATAAAGKGGTVQALGMRVGVVGNGVIDASGDTGGGTVQVGGDYQGGNPAVQNAASTEIGSDGVIRANAGGSGDGGRVIVWSDGDTRVAGSISVRGGNQAGNGGFIEASGKHTLSTKGMRVDARAPRGTWGSLLLDPTNYTVEQDDVDFFNDVGSLTILAGMILLDEDLSLAYGDGLGSFTLQAGLIDMAGRSISSSGQANISLRADTVGIINGGNISTGGGTFTARADAGSINLGTIDTRGTFSNVMGVPAGTGGAVDIRALNGITINGSILSSGSLWGANGGDITLQNSAGNISVNGDINANGSGSFYSYRGNGGHVLLANSSPSSAHVIQVSGVINAKGGDGTDVGGDGGSVEVLNAGAVYLQGGIDVSGGRGGSSLYYSGAGGDGGYGGSVTIRAGSAAGLSNIYTRGGDGGNGGPAGSYGPGGRGGDGGLSGSLSVYGGHIFMGEVNGSGGAGGNGGAGNAIFGGGPGGFGGSVQTSIGIGTTGTLSFGGNFFSTGGNGGNHGAYNGSSSSSSGNAGNGGNGGGIYLSETPSAITFENFITVNTSGGAGGNGALGTGSPVGQGGNGGNAGNIPLTVSGNSGSALVEFSANGGAGGNAASTSTGWAGWGGDAGSISLSGFASIGSASAVGGMAGTGGGYNAITGGTAGTVTINNLAGSVAVGALSSYAGRNADNTYGTSGNINIYADGAVTGTGAVITRGLLVTTNATTAGLAGNVSIGNTANQIDAATIRGDVNSTTPVTGNIDYASRGFTLTPTGVFRATGDINLRNPNPNGGFIVNGFYSGASLTAGSGVVAGGAINLVSDGLSVTTATMNTAGTVFQWYPLSNGLQMQIYNSVLAQFSAPMVKFGNVANTGGLVLMDSIAPASVQTLSLINGGQIYMSNSANTVSVTNLNVDGSQVTLNGTNNVVQLQGQARAGNFTFSNSGNIVLGIADSGNGITGVGATGNVVLSSVNGSIVSTATSVNTIKGGTGVQLDALNGTLGTAAAPLSIATPAFTAFSKGGMYATLNQYAPQFVQAQSIQNTTTGDIALKLYGGGQFNSKATNGGPGNVDILTFSPLNVLAGASSGGNLTLRTSGSGNNGMTLDGPFTVGPNGTFTVDIGTGGALTRGSSFTGSIASLDILQSTSSTTAALASPTVSQVIATTTTKEIVQTAGISNATQKTDTQDDKKKRDTEKRNAGKC